MEVAVSSENDSKVWGVVQGPTGAHTPLVNVSLAEQDENVFSQSM